MKQPETGATLPVSTSHVASGHEAVSASQIGVSSAMPSKGSCKTKFLWKQSLEPQTSSELLQFVSNIDHKRFNSNNGDDVGFGDGSAELKNPEKKVRISVYDYGYSRVTFTHFV